MDKCREGYEEIDPTPVTPHQAGGWPLGVRSIGMQQRDQERSIREQAELDALTLPPHLRPAAVERMVAERTAAATQRGIEKALEDQVVNQLETHRLKVRVEVPANLRPQETNVYFDGQKVRDVVAVRVQTRPNGEQETYLVLRVRDAEIQMAEGFADLEFGRLDLAVRQVRGFDVGTSMDSRRPVGMEHAFRELEG